MFSLSRNALSTLFQTRPKQREAEPTVIMMPKKKPEPMGFFRSLAASVVTGEILYHWYALRGGEDYPVAIYITHRGDEIIEFPQMEELIAYINKYG